MRRRKSNKKALALLVSVILLVTVVVGATLAYLVDVKGPIENTFTPSNVTVEVNEEFDGKEKKDVSIKNTGDTAAYIRAAVIVTWQNADGEVLGQKPVEGTDYSITYNLNAQTAPKGKWVKNGDYYYWNQPVAAGENTGILINEIKLEDGITPPTGYFLCVEIIASGIQSDGTKDNTKAVVDAWGIDPSTLS